VPFSHSPADRARLTGTSRRALYRTAAVVAQLEMDGLSPDPPDEGRRRLANEVHFLRLLQEQAVHFECLYQRPVTGSGKRTRMRCGNGAICAQTVPVYCEVWNGVRELSPGALIGRDPGPEKSIGQEYGRKAHDRRKPPNGRWQDRTVLSEK
jgi:hypothetical protein